MPGTSPRPSAARGGFTLIEVIAATLIFFLMVTFALWAMSDSYDQSMAAQDARILRMLAERKLGEIAVFEGHYDPKSGIVSGRFDDLPDEIRDTYADWEWEAEVRDVTAIGDSTDPNAPPLFPSGETETVAAGTEAAAAGDQAQRKAREGIKLREIVLRVKSPADDGDSTMVEVVTYLPQVPQKTAGGTGGTGGGN